VEEPWKTFQPGGKDNWAESFVSGWGGGSGYFRAAECCAPKLNAALMETLGS